MSASGTDSNLLKDVYVQQRPCFMTISSIYTCGVPYACVFRSLPRSLYTLTVINYSVHHDHFYFTQWHQGLYLISTCHKLNSTPENLPPIIKAQTTKLSMLLYSSMNLEACRKKNHSFVETHSACPEDRIIQNSYITSAFGNYVSCFDSNPLVTSPQ